MCLVLDVHLQLHEFSYYKVSAIVDKVSKLSKNQKGRENNSNDGRKSDIQSVDLKERV